LYIILVTEIPVSVSFIYWYKIYMSTPICIIDNWLYYNITILWCVGIFSAFWRIFKRYEDVISNSSKGVIDRSRRRVWEIRRLPYTPADEPFLRHCCVRSYCYHYRISIHFFRFPFLWQYRIHSISARSRRYRHIINLPARVICARWRGR